MAIDREAVKWDFNALFHYCGMNPMLRSILPPLPWNHSEGEAREVIRRLMTVTFKKAFVPYEAKLLKLYFVTCGLTDMKVLYDIVFVNFKQLSGFLGGIGDGLAAGTSGIDAE
jgi:hypothetical protein